MAYEPRTSKYPPEIHHTHHHPRSADPNAYPYALHPPQTDENRNENNCDNKETHRRNSHTSSGTQTIQKVDAATMTDPLRIDFRLTSEYLARCSNNIGGPYGSKYEESSESTHSCHQARTKVEYDVEPRHINGMLIYHCPECAYRFQDRESLHEHLEEHRQRPHICDICGVSLKRKEHLDRHKQGHNKDRPYQCSMCCKAFKRNEHLARHMIIHSGSKNQICTECGKAFYRKDHLKKHLQSHNGTRGKPLGDSHQQSVNSQVEGQQNSSTDGLGNFAMMMRQAGPPPFSILRT
ncbi:zinc finger protein 543 [Diachasma alloeum]|uniref:zinc finger protein 543 n=1 Tax=Diachasma alloeum TaxID=454923 RepID=UPI0007384B26|nr:zinc finger protein 543 [Diachasma alloeum]